MKKTLIIALFLFSINSAFSQFVATVEVKDSIPGICNQKEVYSLFPGFTGQVEATCEQTNKQIEKKLNEEVKFLKDNPKHKDECMISIYVNCKGEMVKCEMDNKSKNPELDAQIEAVFKTLSGWKAGTLNGTAVDSMLIFSIKIKKGKITLE